MPNKRSSSRRKPQSGHSKTDKPAAATPEHQGDHDEHDVLSNPRHEAFAQAVANGDSDVVAYQKAFGCTRDSAEASATRMRENAGILARITELQGRIAKQCEMTRGELVGILVKTLRAKPSEAGLDNPLCDLRMSKAGPYPAFIDKSKAAERLCKMLGWDEPDKVEHSGDVTVNVVTEEQRSKIMELRRAALTGGVN